MVYAPKNFTVRPDVEINQMAKDIADKKGAGMIVLCNNKNERNKLTKAYDRQREKIEIRIPVIAILENQNVSFNIKNGLCKSFGCGFEGNPYLLAKELKFENFKQFIEPLR